MMTLKLHDLSAIQVNENHLAAARFTESAVLPPDMAGAEILRIGAPADSTTASDGGGLVIDYLAHGTAEAKRIVLDFNELGMWVIYHGPIRQPA